MEKNAFTDSELLKEWLAKNREASFHALVSRYANLVYATAKRSCGDATLAAEASQLTFIALAQKAKSLTSYSTLGGWLHLTAVMQAKNLVRKSQREVRKRSLLQATMDTKSHPSHIDTWQEMQPALDEALASLSAKDREALILRFYRSLTVREIAAALGISTDAVHKRTDRATERLRSKLAHRGFLTSGSLSAVMVAGYASEAQAVPLSVSMVTSKAIAAAAVGSSSLLPSLLTLTLIMKSSSFIIPAIVAVAVTSWITYQRQSLSLVNHKNATLQQSFVSGVTAPRGAFVSTQQNSQLPQEVPKKTTQIQGSIGGKKLIIQVAETLKDQESETDPIWGFVEKQISLFNKEELINALEELEHHRFHHSTKGRLIEDLYATLSKVDPEERFTRQGDKVMNSKMDDKSFTLAFSKWVSEDDERARMWLDQMDRAGKFESKRLDNKENMSDILNARLIDKLLIKNRDAAKLRLESLSNERLGAISSEINSIYGKRRPSLSNFKDFSEIYAASDDEPDIRLQECYEIMKQSQTE